MLDPEAWFNTNYGPGAHLMVVMLQRLAREPALLIITPEEAAGQPQIRARHKVKGAPCQGCRACNGPSWHHKTLTLALLWARASKYFSTVGQSYLQHTRMLMA